MFMLILYWPGAPWTSIGVPQDIVQLPSTPAIVKSNSVGAGLPPAITEALPIPWTENSFSSKLLSVVAKPCIVLNHLPSLSLNSNCLPSCKSVWIELQYQPAFALLL